MFQKTFSCQNSAAKRKRNAVSNEGIDKSSGVTNLKNPSLNRFRLVKDEWRRADLVGRGPPGLLPAAQSGVKIENLYQFSGNLRFYHRARIYHTLGMVKIRQHDGLHPAIPALEKIEIHGR